MTNGASLYTLVQPTGVAATDLAAVQGAIETMAASGADGVVLLGIGRFRFASPLAMRSNIALMGLSKEKTILDFDVDGTSTADCGLVASIGTTWSTTTIASSNRVGSNQLSFATAGTSTTVSDDFQQPEVGETVTVHLGSTTGLAVDYKIFISGGGAYVVEEITDSTHAVLRNLGWPGNATVGSTITALNSIVVGAIVLIRDSVSGSNFHGGCYRVVGFTGAGPYTATLERPVNFQFGAGDVVEWISDQVENCKIGNFTIEGRAARAVEFLTVRDCVMQDFSIQNWTSNGPSDLTASFDTFSYRCLSDGVTIDARNASSVVPGFGLESNEGTSIRRLTVYSVGLGAIALRINDGCDCSVEDYFGRGDGTNGWGLKANPEVSGNGPVRLSLNNIDVEGFGIGVDLESAKDATIENVRSFNNAGWNIIFGGTTTVKATNLIASGVATVIGVYAATFYTNYGVQMTNTAVAFVKNIDTTDCKFGIYVGATNRLHLDGHTHKGASGSDGNNQQARLSSLGTVFAKNLDYSDWTSGYRAVQATGGTMFIAQSNFAGTTDFVGVISIGAKVYIETSTFSGFTAANNVDAGAGGEIVFGKGLGINPTVASGGKVNAGTFALNGATPVVVSNVPTLLGLIAGGDARIRIQLKTVGGVQGKEPIVVAGTNQFTVTGTAGDTSTYAWMVE